MTQLEISVHFRIELISVQYSYISISLLIPHTWRKSLKPNTLWIVNQNTFISMHHTHLNFWWSVIWLNLYANREGFLFSWLREFAGAIISCANVESTLLIVLCIARLYVYLHRQFIFVFTYLCDCDDERIVDDFLTEKDCIDFVQWNCWWETTRVKQRNGAT